MPDLFDYARQAAEAGMQQAVEHADEVESGWSDRALDCVSRFARIRLQFLGEDVRVWAYDQGLPHPPVECAWGAVMVRAAKARIIDRAGYATTKIPPQHAKTAALWRSLVFRKEPQ